MSTYPPGLLCVIAACQCELDAHLAGCHDDRCRGCLPLRAEKKSRTCTACRLHARDRLGELATLHTDLLTPTRLPNSGGRASGGTERPQTLADPAVQARSQIQDALTAWCKLLEDDLDITAPATDVRTMVIHLLAHLRTLLASEHAERWCEAIDEIWTDARKSAYPSGVIGQALGQCPTCDTLIRSTTAVGKVRCRGCGTSQTLDEWRKLLVGDLDADASATAADLASWLSARHDRALAESTLRNWVTRGVMLPGPDGKRARTYLTLLETDSGGRGLYSVADAATIATGLYGPTKVGISA